MSKLTTNDWGEIVQTIGKEIFESEEKMRSEIDHKIQAYHQNLVNLIKDIYPNLKPLFELKTRIKWFNPYCGENSQKTLYLFKINEFELDGIKFMRGHYCSTYYRASDGKMIIHEVSKKI